MSLEGKGWAPACVDAAGAFWWPAHGRLQHDGWQDEKQSPEAFRHQEINDDTALTSQR